MLPARHPVPPPGEDEITLSRWGRWPSSPSLPAFLVAHLDPDGPSQCTSFQALEVPAAVNNNSLAVALTPDRDCIHLHRAQRNRRRATSPARRATRNSITRRALPGAVRWRTTSLHLLSGRALAPPWQRCLRPGVVVLLESHPPPCAVAFSPWPGSGTAPGGLPL